MPVYSMTGYASAASGASEVPTSTTSPDPATPRSASHARSSVTVEIRSVNGRFLDLGLRLPDEFRALEPALRDLLTGTFRRGKIELRLHCQSTADTAWPQPQSEQLNRLIHLQGTVQGWFPSARGLSVNEILHWCKTGGIEERLDDVALETARRAILALVEARAGEGSRLTTTLLERVARLRDLAAQAEPLVPATVQRQQQKFLDRWREALEQAGAAQTMTGEALRDRALNEAAAFAIRIDVAEELARLRSHLDEMERLLKAGGEVGKQLDFLIQELLREANTLGSKSSALELTNVSLEMKVLIEQLREQVQNLE